MRRPLGNKKTGIFRCPVGMHQTMHTLEERGYASGGGGATFAASLRMHAKLKITTPTTAATRMMLIVVGELMIFFPHIGTFFEIKVQIMFPFLSVRMDRTRLKPWRQSVRTWYYKG